MSVSRDEFDKLVDRVNRIEQTLGATVEIVSAEVVGLRTYLAERFAHVEERFGHMEERFGHMEERFGHVDARLDGMQGQIDGVERKLDTYTEQVQVAIRQGSDATARNERFARAIADHFDIQLPPDDQ